MISRIRRRPAGEDGFTLVELTVAMVVTMLALSSLIIVFLGSIKGVALAKQRQAATGLATAMMEQFRSLDYGTLSAGLYCGDVTGDANLTVSGSCGAGGTVTLAPPGSGINETVKVQTSALPASPLPPIYPHVTTKTVENVTYTRKAYVTVSPTTPAAFNLTVLVSWSSSSSKGTKTVTERSTEYSPSRCLSSSTHPYSGACQAAFNGDAGFAKALITITDSGGSGQDITGFDGRSVQLSLGSLSSTLAVEQITKLTGNVQTTSATAITGSGKTTTGGSVATVAVDSDPSSTTGGTQTASTSQTASTVSISGDAGVLTAAPATGGSGSLDARVSSTATSCNDAAGNTIAAALRPCGWGTRQSSGTAGNLALQLPNGAPNFTIASVGAAPAPARATVAMVPGSGGTACPTASGAGCLTAQASRSLGAISLGGLPTTKTGDSPPVGWTGSLISLSGVTESAYAESGIGARAPQFTRSAGTLNYYDATTMSMHSLDLSALASDQSVTVPTVNATYVQGGHTEVFQMSATFTAGASTAGSQATPDPTCKSQACTASANASSTLRATVVYSISMDGNPTTTFAMSVDLGACVARSSYTAAFDA